MAIGRYRTGVTFTPLTFDEMIKPSLMYTEAYNTAQNDILDMSKELSPLAQYAQAYPDSQLADQYNTLISNIDKASGDLLNGLNPNTMRDLLGLKRQANALATIGKDATDRFNNYRTYLMEHPDIITTPESLDFNKFYINPAYVPQNISGDDVEKAHSVLATNLASSLKPEERGYILNKTKALLAEGYEGDDLYNAIFNPNDSNIPEELLQGVQALSKKFNASESTLGDNYFKYQGRAYQGLLNGLLKYSVTDSGEMTPYQRAQVNLAREEFNWKKQQYEDQTNKPERLAWIKAGYDPDTHLPLTSTPTSTTSKNKLPQGVNRSGVLAVYPTVTIDNKLVSEQRGFVVKRNGELVSGDMRSSKKVLPKWGTSGLEDNGRLTYEQIRYDSDVQLTDLGTNINSLSNMRKKNSVMVKELKEYLSQLPQDSYHIIEVSPTRKPGKWDDGYIVLTDYDYKQLKGELEITYGKTITDHPNKYGTQTYVEEPSVGVQRLLQMTNNLQNLGTSSNNNQDTIIW